MSARNACARANSGRSSCARGQRRPQPPFAPVRQREAASSSDSPTSGDLQQRRQGQIVLRQQRETPQRDQIGDRDLVDQHHAVGARHRHAALHELADHLAREVVAAPHQDHDVARRDRRAAFRQRRAAVSATRDALGDLRRQRASARFAAKVHRPARPQDRDPASSSPSTAGQISTRPALAIGLVRGSDRPSRSARRAPPLREHRIDEIEHAPRAASRHRGREIGERQLRLLGVRLEEFRDASRTPRDRRPGN